MLFVIEHEKSVRLCLSLSPNIHSGHFSFFLPFLFHHPYFGMTTREVSGHNHFASKNQLLLFLEYDMFDFQAEWQQFCSLKSSDKRSLY